MLLSTQLMRRNLPPWGIALAALIVLFPVNGTTAQQEGDLRDHPTKLLNYSKITTQQLADEGEKVIFGRLGQSKVQGAVAVGKGQCPLCHSFNGNIDAERAPDLRGVTGRAPNRLKDPRYHLGKPDKRDTVQHEAFLGSGTATNTLEYLAESDLCHSCYVVAGYGIRGTHDTDSAAPSSLYTPISLSINDVVALTTWLYVNDGKEPPSPHEIEDAYKKFVDPPRWEAMVRTRDTPPHEGQQKGQLFATGEEAVSDIFRVAQCTVCHTIPGIPGAVGTHGPKLTMKTHAPARIKDETYRGKATTVREYITESILYPSVYVTKGYPDNLMPKVYGNKLKGLAIDKMVDYLAEVEDGKIPPPIK